MHVCQIRSRTFGVQKYSDGFVLGQCWPQLCGCPVLTPPRMTLSHNPFLPHTHTGRRGGRQTPSEMLFLSGVSITSERDRQESHKPARVHAATHAKLHTPSLSLSVTHPCSHIITPTSRKCAEHTPALPCAALAEAGGVRMSDGCSSCPSITAPRLQTGEQADT